MNNKAVQGIAEYRQDEQMKTLSRTFLPLLLWLPGILTAGGDHEHETPLAVASGLTLHDVVEHTYQRNPEIRIIEARLKHVNARMQRAKSFWPGDPSFTVNHYNDAVMDSDGLREWEAGVEMPLWLPGQKDAQQHTVEQEKSVVGAGEAALRLKLAGIIRELLWNIALSKNQVSAARHEWQVVQKLAADVNKRVQLGDLAQSDLILAEQESLTKEAALRKAEQEYRHAQHRYDMITGLRKLPAEFVETATPDPSINDNHPVLIEASEKVASSTAMRDQVMLENRGNPTVFLGTRHERSTSGDDFANAIGLSFRMPFGTSAHTTPKLTAAEVDLTETRSEMELLYRDLNIAMEDAIRELEMTREQYDFARRKNELTQRNLELSRKAFALGETSLIELIRIQAQAFTAERNMHQKQLEVGLHTARLNQARGIIP